jgi:hypothetical protein
MFHDAQNVPRSRKNLKKKFDCTKKTATLSLMKNYRWSSIIIAQGAGCELAWKACQARAMKNDVFQIVPATFTEYIVEFSSANRTVFRWFKK